MVAGGAGEVLTLHYEGRHLWSSALGTGVMSRDMQEVTFYLNFIDHVVHQHTQTTGEACKEQDDDEDDSQTGEEEVEDEARDVLTLPITLTHCLLLPPRYRAPLAQKDLLLRCLLRDSAYYQIITGDTSDPPAAPSTPRAHVVVQGTVEK